MSVYFATCRDANAVKIGSSVDPHGRLPEIQVGCPLLVVMEAILPGGRDEEFTFHRRFEDDHIRGEWFRLNEMIELIIQLNPAPPSNLEGYARRTVPLPRKPKPIRESREQLTLRREADRSIKKRVDAGEIAFPFRAGEPAERLDHALREIELVRKGLA